MSQYRKKQLVIEAMQWDGSSPSALAIMRWAMNKSVIGGTYHGSPFLSVFTREGRMNASAGDWIIKGVKGEFYPCKPDIFESTYDPA